MADAYTTIALSEQRDILAPALTPSALSSTATTATINGGTVTLRDSYGQIAGGVGASPITGATSGSSSGPQAWFLVKPTVLLLAAGLYTLTFSLSVTVGTVTRTVEQMVGLKVIRDYL